MSNKYLVVDTAVLLHYKSIDQIDWSNISGCKTPTIYVPLVVIEELDKHKDQHRLRKMRERARKALALIDKIIGESFSGRLRNNVQLVVESEDPEIDWEGLNLDKNKPDHRVIASALSMVSDSNQVAVVYRDYGIKLTLRKLNLQSVELPAELQLEDALDESDREIKELRLENERLKSQFPKLCLESGEAVESRSDSGRSRASFLFNDRTRGNSRETPREVSFDEDGGTSEAGFRHRHWASWAERSRINNGKTTTMICISFMRNT